jgi:hypothetical protein
MDCYTGRTLNHLGRYEEAEVAYWSAKTLLPRARPGEKLVTRYRYFFNCSDFFLSYNRY